MQLTGFVILSAGKLRRTDPMRKIFSRIISELSSWLYFLVRWMPGDTGTIIRYYLYRASLARCGKKLNVSPGCYLRDCRNITIGDRVNIGLNSQIYAAGEGTESITIGNNVGMNSNVMLNADCGGQIIIGNNVLIGPNCVLRASNHEFSDVRIPIKAQGHRSGRIIIEDDVWLGSNVVILPDVIGKTGAVIAAGAVVTKDVDSFCIVGGVPAKVIAKRNAV